MSTTALLPLLGVTLLLINCSEQEGRPPTVTEETATKTVRADTGPAKVEPTPVEVKVTPAGTVDEQGALAFASAVPAGTGKVDTTLAPVRWEVRGLEPLEGIVVGRYISPEGPRMALVSKTRSKSPTPDDRLDLPGTHSVQIFGVVDLDMSTADGTPPMWAAPEKVIEVPQGALAPALLLSAEQNDPAKGGRTNLVGVDLRGGTPKLVLTFPLVSFEKGSTHFSTIGGPNLKKGAGPWWDVELVQHAHPSSAEGLPGPPTFFTCRFSDEQYTCRR